MRAAEKSRSDGGESGPMGAAQRRVIITADDFGLAPEINEAVERAHREGVLRSASLMVGAPFAADAVRRARRMPQLAVGLHVTVVHGAPVLPPHEVPDLVDAAGRFSTRLVQTGVRYFALKNVRRQLEREIRAQFEAYARTGLSLDHIDGQAHMHVHPTVYALMLRIGREFGARAVRIPYEPVIRGRRAARRSLVAQTADAAFLAPWLGLMRVRARAAGLATNDAVFGMNDTGAMDEGRVLDVLAHLPEGTSELYFHPATAAWDGRDPALENYAFAQELAALLSPAVDAALRRSDIRVVTYGELAR